MTFYVGENAEQNAAAVWEAVGKNPSDSRINTFVNSDAAVVHHQKQQAANPLVGRGLRSAPQWTRTINPLIKSQMLCQLS